MTTYAALLRGIMPMNPNTRNEKLREAFEAIGFKDVQTIISSGNVIFKSKSENAAKLEDMVEKTLAVHLGFKSSVMIRSKDELEKLIQKNPFKGKEHGRKSYLTVTFMKKDPREAFTVLDMAKASGPDLMIKLEKKYGKVITTRTWKTVNRIVEKMNNFV